MIGPLAAAKVAIMTCTKITEAVRLVSANEVQCQRLAERVRLISTLIQGLMSNLPSEEGEQEDKILTTATEKMKSLNAQVYQAPLDSLKKTLEEALSLVEDFSSRREWYLKIFDTFSTNSKFSAIYNRLGQDIQQLQLGLNVHQFVNPAQDLRDQEADYQKLLQKQDEIISLNQEAGLKNQQLVMDEEQRHYVLLQQLESMKLSIANMRPTGKRESTVSEKLLVRFHDLAIDNLLWNGERSKVYLGRWLEQVVAIKVLNAHFTSQEQEEFIREINIMKELRSEFVMPLYAACNEPGRACLIMKYMRHGSLRELLDKAVSFTDLQKNQLIIDIALGLYYLHRKDIIHRDLKTGNILVDEVGRARISDFGLSRSYSGRIETLCNPVFDFNYLAPEVLGGTGEKDSITKAIDVYALGNVMWEILTGKTLYAGLTREEIINKIVRGEHEVIPAEAALFYQEILKECWQKNLLLRPSIETVTKRLRQYQSGQLKGVNAFVFWEPIQEGSAQAFNEKSEKEKQSPLTLSTHHRDLFTASTSAFSTKRDSRGQTFFMAGQGFELDKNHEKALKSYRKAGELTYLSDESSGLEVLNGETFFMAGKSFEQKKQFGTAMEYYQKATSLNYGRANVTQAKHYLQGTCGVMKDEGKARQLLKVAAEKGNIAAMRMVGILYEEGLGVSIDLTIAKAYYRKAGDAGDEEAQKRLKKLAIPRMSARGGE